MQCHQESMYNLTQTYVSKKKTHQEIHLSTRRKMRVVLHSGPIWIINYHCSTSLECRHMFLVFCSISETYVYNVLSYKRQYSTKSRSHLGHACHYYAPLECRHMFLVFCNISETYVYNVLSYKKVMLHQVKVLFRS